MTTMEDRVRELEGLAKGQEAINNLLTSIAEKTGREARGSEKTDGGCATSVGASCTTSWMVGGRRCCLIKTIKRTPDS